jgi:hypothetical protein
MRLLLPIVMMLLCLGGSAQGGPAADQLARDLAAGQLQAGITAQGPAADSDDKEALAARGSLRFLSAIEHLAQALYRHGLETTSGGPMMNLPVLRIPVAPNPHPEPLDYAGFRAILERLVSDLDAAEADLAGVGDAEVKLPVDLATVRLDLNGDGTSDANESLGAMMLALTHGDATATPPTVSFDTADIYWLRGYSKFIGAFSQFMLAHNFADSFNKTFHLYFPHAGLPLADKLVRTDPSAWSDGAIGDAISFIHLVSWDVIDPSRLADARLRLKAMAELSRMGWAAARRETDNDREWLPNARQSGVFGSVVITDAEIDGWLAIMDEFDAILDGRKLMPHWRFHQGLNVKRMFAEEKRFDLVLLIAGPDAVPWLEDGPVSDMATWENLMRTFGDNFLGYAMFFN